MTQIVGALIMLLAVLVGIRVRRQIPGWLDRCAEDVHGA